ncbi:MAG: hypothetical protein U0835_18415 [Isosphaeraceae bacterium]
MCPLPTPGSRYRSLQASQRALARAAPLARFAVLSVGAAVFLDQVKPLLSDAQFTWGERRVMGIVALSVFVSFGLGAWAAGMLLRAASELIEVLVDLADAATRTDHLVETQIGPNLARAAAALERLASTSAPAAAGTPSREAAEVREAIAAGRWGKAGRLVREMRARTPNAPEVAALRPNWPRHARRRSPT